MKSFEELTIRKLWFFLMFFQKLFWLISSNLGRTLEKEGIEIYFRITPTACYYKVSHLDVQYHVKSQVHNKNSSEHSQVMSTNEKSFPPV